jgi:hypothetical protein
MQKPNVSQSIIKVLTEYFHEDTLECGVKIRKQYFEKIPTPHTEAQALGIYFEYMATGYLPKDTLPPVPDKVYVGTAREKLSADYQRANESAELFKLFAEKYGIEIITTGEYMNHDGVSGITDIRAKFNGEECIIDLKYSSLFDDKFTDFGWHVPSLPMKPKLMLQPTHYKWLARRLYGVHDMPFYFWIFSAKDSMKAKIIRCNIDEAHVDIHDTTIDKIRQYIDHFYNNPDKLEARPKYLRCMECPFYNDCDHKIVMPEVETVYY